MPVGTRKDTGKWGYRHWYHGKNYRKHVWDNRDEAIEAFKEFLDRLKRELFVIDSNISLVEAVNKFLEFSALIGKSEWRLKALHTNFKRFIIPSLHAETRLKDITHLNIEFFIKEQLKRQIKKNTINHYFIDLNSLLNWAVNEKIISANPVKDMKKEIRKMIRPDKIIKEGHTPEQIRACEAVLNNEERLFFRFLKFTGARLAEALTMKWDDVYYQKNDIILRGTKTEESLRKIVMCESLLSTLKELEKYKTESPYLFHKKDGSRILRKDKLFKKIKKLTGIKITAKDLRDYYASIMIKGDDVYRPDIVTVQRSLGHKNIATTQKYLYPFKDSEIKAVGIFDRIEAISTDVSTGQGVTGRDRGVKPCSNWWRCRESNPGHCGYEPHALTD